MITWTLRRAGLRALAAAGAALVLSACVASVPPRGTYTVDGIVDGFSRTVFGAEYDLIDAFRGSYVHKFQGPVRVYVALGDPADTRRRNEVHRFIRRIDRLIDGLDIAPTGSEAQANFVVHVVPRARYADTVRNRVYRNASAPVRGRCLVRSQFSRAGNERSDAVLVSDEGDALFQRCMTEEILQGLGPLNDDPTLSASMFNDTTNFTSFRRFDRLIMNVLYDARIRSGDTPSDLIGLLPNVARDTLKRIGPLSARRQTPN
ncbi:DUF2927 domain-containing protein [Rhizobiaceae bacterium]|nr:DUF2927 domain-containing protein [Rhizobiaceae bacterium]